MQMGMHGGVAFLALFVVVCGTMSSGYRMSSSDEPRVMAAAVAAANEPSCEELRVMWRFSKRQSRAAEITNELPTYRDPLAYNVWDAYARTRSGGGARRRPVFGRIIHDARVPSPYEALLTAKPDRLRAFEEVTRLYGDQNNNGFGRASQPRTSFRGVSVAQPPPQTSGQFQHLKELIKSERAQELLEQRIKDEAVARAQALKDIVNQVHFGRIVQHQKGQLEQAVADRVTYADQPNANQGHGLRSQLIAHKRTPYPFIVDDFYYDDQDINDNNDGYLVTYRRDDASFRPRPHPQRSSIDSFPSRDIQHHLDVDSLLSKSEDHD